jgi:hypothetical protein
LYGIHLPNEGGGDGGYRIFVDHSSVNADGNRVAKISIQHILFINDTDASLRNSSLGTGVFAGFLLKSYDPVSGSPLGSFRSPLPTNTMFYPGCPVPECAISHSFNEEQIEADEHEFSLEEEEFSLTFAWPATKRVAFQFFVVEGETVWFEVRSMDVYGTIPPEPPFGCLPQVSVNYLVVGLLPIGVMLFVGLMLSLESTSTVISQLNHIFVLGPKFSRGAGSSRLSARYWMTFLTFGAWDVIVAASVVEAIAYALFFSTQAVALVLASAWVIAQARSTPSPSRKIYPLRTPTPIPDLKAQ